MLERPLAFLDLETTGANASRDRITEIGLVEVDNGHYRDEWSTLVNPQADIPPFIESLTGITNDMVAGAPVFAQVAEELRARLDGRLLVAHNARFDYGFLKEEFQRFGITFRSEVVCTVKLSRKLYPGHARHNLDSLMARHGVTCSARHRALGDARVLWDLAQNWRDELGESALAAAATAQLRKLALPAALRDFVFEDIPETPGFYVFFARGNVPLFVGKGTNVRARVLSHLAAGRTSPRDMRIAREATRIDWKETAGHLGACLRAAQLVRELAPVLNPQERRPGAGNASDDPGAWPFPGRIAVRESSGGRVELHVIDRWRHLVTLHGENDMDTLGADAGSFDPGTYSILKRFLKPGHVLDIISAP